MDINIEIFKITTFALLIIGLAIIIVKVKQRLKK